MGFLPLKYPAIALYVVDISRDHTIFSQNNGEITVVVHGGGSHIDGGAPSFLDIRQLNSCANWIASFQAVL